MTPNPPFLQRIPGQRFALRDIRHILGVVRWGHPPSRRKGAQMPLSEHEQKLLEQMEQALYADDPKFATNIRTAGGSASRGRAALGVLAVLAGLGLLLAGVAFTPALGVAGFTVMLIGAVITYTAFTTRAVITDSSTDSSGAETPIAKMPKPPKSGGFMDRMEDRWRKRTEGEQ